MKRGNHIVCAFLRLCIRQMKALGLNQTALASRLNVSRPYVTKLLRGDVNISFAAAERLARALQMDFTPTLTPHSATNAPSCARPILVPCGPRAEANAVMAQDLKGGAA